MALRPKHRREIRDLLRVLYDDKAWQPHHTDRLLGIVRATRSDVAEEVETTVTQELATYKRANLALQGQVVEAMRDIEKFRHQLSGIHAKIAVALEAMVDMPLAKAIVNGELDPAAINDKDAKIALAAMDKIMRATGAYAPQRLEVDSGPGGAFEYLGEIEAEES